MTINDKYNDIQSEGDMSALVVESVSVFFEIGLVYGAIIALWVTD